MTVTLDGLTTAAWARLYADSNPRPDLRPSICRSSVGQPITGYAGAPAALPIDVALPHAFGSGWHGPEGAADDRFRWTAAADADVLFAAQRPQPLSLRLDAEPGTGDWETVALRVSLNGTPARCREGAPPCEWSLPVEAMRTGLNVITLHSQTVPAPAPETRQLGLMVRRLELVRP